MWLGRAVPLVKRCGSLHILKCVMTKILNESIKYQPGYMNKSQNILSIRMRIEMQGFESAKLTQLMGRIGSVPGSENRTDYLMCRIARQNFVDSTEASMIEIASSNDLNSDANSEMTDDEMHAIFAANLSEVTKTRTLNDRSSMV